MANYTRLGGTSATFAEMMKKFGVVTVMNAKVCTLVESMEAKTPAEIIAAAKTQEICELDTLKIANVSIEGPTKTITGGQYSNPLIKFGKTARLEMQDALGNAYAIDKLCGGLTETEDKDIKGTIAGLHIGSDFNAAVTIIGESFFLNEKGEQVKVNIVFYQFLPDSIFNLTQDAEGDATVFDMNGDLLMTDVLIPNQSDTPAPHGLFYSIVEAPKAE